MALGYLHITEYAYRGDPSVNIPLEPATVTQVVEIGSVSKTLHPDTQLVRVFATRPCRVLFFAGDKHDDGDPVPDGGWPIGESAPELHRVPMNTGMKVAANPEGAM